MITKQELARIKQKEDTSLYQVEKEYLQYIFLQKIASDQDFTFKGGTCLKIAYDLQRASEDLDFSTNLDLNQSKKKILECLKQFELLGMPYSYQEKEYKDNYRIEVRIQGPLYTGDKRTTNTLKIDCNKKKVYEKETKIIQKKYSDVPVFAINVLSRKEILAEKIRALKMRKQPRDLYDVYMQIMTGVKIAKEIVLKKLKEDNVVNKKIIYPTKKEYEEDLKNLVTILPPYEQVIKTVKEKIIF